MKLRALELKDIDLLYAIENDEAIWASGNTNAPYSRYALEQYILTNLNDFYEDKQLRLVVEEDGTPIGLIDLSNYNAQHQRAEVGIAILKDYQGKGSGTRALQEIARYSTKHLQIHQLYALVSEENIPAQKAFRKAGFEHTSTLKDWIAKCKGTFINAEVYQTIIE